MKKLFFLLMLAIAYNVESQNTFPSNGNVGIGTLTPTTELEVDGEIKATNGIFEKFLPNGSTFIDNADRNSKCNLIQAGKDFGGTSNEFTFNVFDFPQSNLNTQAYAYIGMEDRNFTSRWRFLYKTNASSVLRYYNKTQQHFFNLEEDGSDNVVLNLPFDNSYLTIGTNSYNDNGELYKLSVEGKIRAHGIKVYTSWADFVFEDDYNLPSLHDVEKYIAINGHLENIPSSKEVEQHGIELGEMNKLLLQKIEELTLYLIEQNKKINTLKIEVEKLKKQ